MFYFITKVGILFEIRHLLSLKDSNAEKREAALDLVNCVFAIATRFIDTCKSTSSTSDDIKRLELLKNDYSKQFLNQLTQFQETFI